MIVEESVSARKEKGYIKVNVSYVLITCILY
jgi:hypothetical protein